MQTYLTGNPVTVTIPLADEAGEQIVPVSITYKVLDEDGATIVDATNVPGITGAETEVTITVLGANNTLPLSKLVGAREVQLLVATASGTQFLSVSYRVSVADRLVIPTFSAQSLTSAEMVAADLNGIPGWDAAERPARVGAMLEAYRRIARLKYEYQPEDWQSRITVDVDVWDLSELEVWEWNALPVEMRNAIKIAQVYEADDILTTVADGDRRSDAVKRERIGETEVEWHDRTPPKYTVGQRALKTLSRFLASPNRRIGRA